LSIAYNGKGISEVAVATLSLPHLPLLLIHIL
jgi:hypothetical protein